MIEEYKVSPVVIKLTEGRRIVLTEGKTKAMADDAIIIDIARSAINELAYRRSAYEWPVESEPNNLIAMRERLTSSYGTFKLVEAMLNYPRFQYPDGREESIEPKDLEPEDLPIICQVDKPTSLIEKVITKTELHETLDVLNRYLKTCGRFSKSCMKIYAKADLMLTALVRRCCYKGLISYDDIKPIVDICDEMYVEMTALDASPEELRIEPTGPAIRTFVGFAKDRDTALSAAEMMNVQITKVEDIPEKNGKTVRYEGVIPPPSAVDDRELDRVAHIMVASYDATLEMHQSILENHGIGRYASDSFDRSDLFQEVNIQAALKIFQPDFIKEIERCGLRIQQYESEICNAIELALKVKDAWQLFFKKLKSEFKGAIQIIEAEAVALRLVEDYSWKICSEGGSLHVSAKVINDEYAEFVQKLISVAAFVSQYDSLCDNKKQAVDSKCALTMLLHVLDCAIRGIRIKVIPGIKKHGKTKLQLSEEASKKIREVCPQQREQFDVWEKQFAEGFDPHEFLEPEGPFMSDGMLPFSEDFFFYRKNADEVVGESLQQILTANGQFHDAWSDLLKIIRKELPNCSEVIKLHNAFNRMLQLYERRILMGDDGVEVASFRRAAESLAEKLLDVAAEIKAANEDRIRAAEEKRKNKTQKQSGQKIFCNEATNHVVVESLSPNALEQINIAVKESKTVTEPSAEVISPTVLITTSDNHLTAVRQSRNDLAERFVQAMESISESVDEQGKILNRIDNRSRDRSVAHEEKLARWEIEDRCLQLFNDYKAGRYGANLNEKGKRSIEDLLKHDQIKLILEQECGITTLKALKDAIINARRRKKNTSGE